MLTGMRKAWSTEENERLDWYLVSGQMMKLRMMMKRKMMRTKTMTRKKMKMSRKKMTMMMMIQLVSFLLLLQQLWLSLFLLPLLVELPFLSVNRSHWEGWGSAQ